MVATSQTGRLVLRPADPSEQDAYVAAASRAFAESWRPEDVEVETLTWDYARSLVAEEDGAIVGTTLALDLEMTLPGGPAPVAGVTLVSVLPTHRRRGVLTAMMSRQLSDLHEGGREPVAALWASEAAIYQRFGYGLASRNMGIRVHRGDGAPLRPPADRGRIRLVDLPGDRPVLERVYEDLRGRRPGLLDRSPLRWRQLHHDPEHWRDGASALTAVVHEGPGGPDGYAVYRTRHAWGTPDGVSPLTVVEVHAGDPEVHAALWQYLFGVDLMTEVVGRNLPVDDPLGLLVLNPRGLRAEVKDALWVRLVDVGRALAGRSYARPVDVTLAVTDPRCPWNAGTWRLSGDASGATCEQTGEPAALELTAQELGAAYLGGTTLGQLARAGRVTELRAGALAAASAAFAHDPQPWCADVF